MRTTKELLELTLEYTNKWFKERKMSGLCIVIYRIYCQGFISRTEKIRLEDYVDKHMPHDYQYKGKKCFAKYKGAFGWCPGKLKPRVKFLEDHIQTQTYKL